MKVVFPNLPYGCDFHGFVRLLSFPIPLTFKFRDYLKAPPRKSQFHIFHMSVKMYVYLNMWALIRLLWLFMLSDGGHCPNDQPKNCSCTFFSKRSSLATYIVDCMAMGNEQVPSGIPSNTVILCLIFRYCNWIFAKHRSLFTNILDQLNHNFPFWHNITHYYHESSIITVIVVSDLRIIDGWIKTPSRRLMVGAYDRNFPSNSVTVHRHCIKSAAKRPGHSDTRLLENSPQCKNTTSLSYPSNPLDYTGGMKPLYLLYVGEIITNTWYSL